MHAMVLVKAIEEMAIFIYLVHIKEALILFKFLLIHVLLSTSSIIKLISPVPKQFIIYDINPSNSSLKQLMAFGLNLNLFRRS